MNKCESYDFKFLLKYISWKMNENGIKSSEKTNYSNMHTVSFVLSCLSHVKDYVKRHILRN